MNKLPSLELKKMIKYLRNFDVKIKKNGQYLGYEMVLSFKGMYDILPHL